MAKGGQRVGSGRKRSKLSCDDLDMELLQRLIYEGKNQKQIRDLMNCNKKAIMERLNKENRIDLSNILINTWRTRKWGSST